MKYKYMNERWQKTGFAYFWMLWAIYKKHASGNK